MKGTGAMTRGSSGLQPVYLMIGTDEYRLGKALDRLDDHLAQAGGDPDFNKDVFEGQSANDPALVRASLDTLPFASDFRLVVIRDVDKLVKPVSEAIVSYLADPSPTTVLAMTAQKLAKNTRLYKAAAAVHPKAIVDLAPKKRWELPPVVVKMAAEQGLRMDEPAADALVGLVGESTRMLANELAKLSVALGRGSTVSKADVERLVSRIAEVSPWDFLTEMGRRDVSRAIRLLDLMPTQSVIGLFTLTVARLRELIAAKALAKRPGQTSLAQELGLQAWQVKNHAAWARNYTMEELVGAIKSAPECERRLKSVPDKDGAFRAWVLSFMGRPA